MGDPRCLSHCFGECFGGRQAQTPEEAEHAQVLMGRKAWADDAAAALPELPDLRADQLSLKGSAFYRNRHHNELEPAQWHGDGACSGAPPAEVTVKGSCAAWLAMVQLCPATRCSTEARSL